ncbi:hypothetical protein K6U69_09935, partial [Vibrio alginolyticus]|nr:hypothetical protein [Vibrio alginolyticus]
IIECDPHSATIIFQGLLCKGEYRRCPIPLPDVAITKTLTISATLCIQPHTDPEHPVNYTRAGMGVKFRPQTGLGESQTSDFFGRASQYKSTEREQRDGAHKWETCLHRTKTFQDGSLIVDPVFDIEYHARQASRGIPLKSAPDVKYALVVTV